MNELFLGENEQYTQSDIIFDIEKHLNLIKDNVTKLKVIQKLVKEITFL